jgi:hypothetical protein
VATTFKLSAAAIATLMTTELNSLAATTGAIASAGYDNSTGLYFWGDFELNATYAVAPTANKTVDLYIIPALDGSNYDDGSASILPITCYVGSFVVRNIATAHKLVLRGIPLPPTPFKAILYNAADQALGASGNTLKMVPYYEQGV